MTYEFADLETILKRVKCEENGGHVGGIFAASFVPPRLREPVSNSWKCMNCDATIHVDYPKLGT